MTDVNHVGYFIFTFKCFAQTEIQFRDGFDTMKQRKMTLGYRKVKYKIIFYLTLSSALRPGFLNSVILHKCTVTDNEELNF